MSCAGCDPRPLPAAPLGPGSGVVGLVGLGLQLQRLGRKLLGHPKVLQRNEMASPTATTGKAYLLTFTVYRSGEKGAPLTRM